MRRENRRWRAELPVALVANAWGEESMTMGLRHRSAPIHGVQFHPESIASEQGGALIAAFVEVARNGA